MADVKPEDQKPESNEGPLDALIRDVEDKNTVHEGVVTLLKSISEEVATLKGDAAIGEYTSQLEAHAEALADAVKSNAADMFKGDAPFKAPAPATEEDVKAMEARAHATPHNEAAAAAVDAGMDIKTANEMTKVGSNI